MSSLEQHAGRALLLASILAACGCGGILLRGEKMLATDGDACATDDDCASGLCRAAACQPQWPFGALHDLVVAAGTALRIAAGANLDFDNLWIEEGARLEVGPGSNWTIIGVRGVLRVDGEIRAEAGDGCGGTVSAFAPAEGGSLTGESISYDIPSPVGGAGGRSASGAAIDDLTGNAIGPSDAQPGGRQNCGNGGGGGGGGNGIVASFAEPGGDATIDSGGAGGPSEPIPGGTGATFPGSSGNPGWDADWQSLLHEHTGYGGGGGGGGARGSHGQGLYLKVHALTGTGSIHADGSPGGTGGRGGDGSYWGGTGPNHLSSGGGGGGGGGAGGSGGKIVLRYRVLGDPVFLYPPRTTVFGGDGGRGGSGGSRNGGVGGDGEAGQDGTRGGLGTVSFRTW